MSWGFLEALRITVQEGQKPAAVPLRVSLPREPRVQVQRPADVLCDDCGQKRGPGPGAHDPHYQGERVVDCVGRPLRWDNALNAYVQEAAPCQ